MKMKVNGKVAKMIIDTGASHTVFDKSKITKFVKDNKFTKMAKTTTGLGGNNIDSHHTTINKISLGKISLVNYPGVMLDLSHVNISYAAMGLPEVDGVLGADIFVMFNAVIDYEKKTLTLNDKALKGLEKARKLIVKKSAGRIKKAAAKKKKVTAKAKK